MLFEADRTMQKPVKREAACFEVAKFVNAPDSHEARPRSVRGFCETFRAWQTYDSPIESAEPPKCEVSATRTLQDSKRSQEIVFTRNATEAINLVARTWGAANIALPGVCLVGTKPRGLFASRFGFPLFGFHRGGDGVWRSILRRFISAIASRFQVPGRNLASHPSAVF